MKDHGPERPERPATKGIHRRAERLAADLPPLLVAAERVAATVAQGVHGRRRAGQGETFWQFRRYLAGDPADAIDWRQSAKTDPVYIRETEWEAAQSVWLWRDRSGSMSYASSKDLPTKGERADLLMLALAALLLRGGEHVAPLYAADAANGADGAFGPSVTPGGGRQMLRRLAAMIGSGETGGGLPPPVDLPRYGGLVLFGDFLDPLEDLARVIRGFSESGVRGHLARILDPAEETLPFSGRVLFRGFEGEPGLEVGRVETIAGRYREIIAANDGGLESLAAACGWTMTRHRTDRSPQTALLAIYQALSSGLPGPPRTEA